MTDSSIFPVFIRPELDDSSPAFAEFTRRASTASKSAAASFKADFREITSVISNALSKGVQGGRLNLDVSSLKQAQAEARLFGDALTATLRSAQLLAKETGDTSAGTRQYIIALETASRAQDENRRAIDAEIATYSRLQAAIDATSDANSRLAQSYRATFAEEARLAKLEVANSRFGASIAPAMKSRAVDNGATFSALAELARQQGEAAKKAGEMAAAEQRLARELEELRRAELGAAEGARIIEGVYQNTARAIDHVTKSAAESAAVFERVLEASSEVANRRFTAFISPAASTSALSSGAGYRELEKAARAADEYERQLAELRQQVDPLAFEQARVNKELEFAAVAFQRGDISADQFAARTQQLNTSLSRMRGGFRDTRQGMVQVGQQMQDVAISFISGQRAGTVLAQQLPQLAFAASSFGGKIGQVATTLSGPWGLALVGASFALGAFIDKLLDADDASDKARKSTLDFTNVLDYRRMAIIDFKDAVDQLTQSTRGLIDVQAIAADQLAANAQAAIAENERKLAAVEKEIARIKSFGDTRLNEVALPGLQKQRDELLGTRDQLETSAANARLALLRREVDESVDAAKGVQAQLERKIAELTLQRSESAKAETNDPILAAQRRLKLGDRYITEGEFQRQYRELERQRQTERSAEKNSSRDASLGDMIALIKQLFPGARITSTTGGDHKKNSDHYAGRAIDFVPRGGMKQYTSAEVESILEEAGVDIRRNKSGVKQFFGPGRSAEKPGDHDDHFHFAFEGKAPDPERVLQAQERAAEKLRNQIERTVESVARLRGNFDEAPRDIDRAAAAVMDLDQAIADIDRKLKAGGLTDAQREVLKATRQSAVETRDEVIPDFLRRPFTREISDQRELIDGQNMLLQGRRGEYEVLQDTLDLARLLGAESLEELGTQIQKRGITADQLEIYYQQTDELRRQSVELQLQQERQQKLLSVVDQVSDSLKNGIYDFLSGRGLSSAKTLLKDLFETQKRALTEDIFTAVFGDAFQRQKLKILGLDQVDETGKAMAKAMAQTISPIDALGKAAGRAADVLDRIAANDNGGIGGQQAVESQVEAAVAGSEIVVTAQKSVQRELNDALKTLGDKILGEKFTGQLGKVMSTVLKGAAFGEASSGILRSLGIKQSKTGAQIGGAIGNAAFGPIGGFVGGAIGGTIGGFFKKTPKGSATITGFDNDVGYSGSKKLREGVTALGNSVQGTLNNIVDALGGDFGNFAVSIGQRKKKFTVDPTGRGRTKGAGVLKFASEEEATMAAIRDAILDGAVKGIREGAQRLLRAGKDLDKQLQKAVDFQGVFQRLKEHDDPVGAALDTLDREFERLKDIFKEAGASAAEYADLERLYGIERAQAIKEASERITASLKSLYDELTVGDNGRSLRDRLSAAQAAYDPLKARVLAGDKSAYDDFASAAQSLLEIQRQFSGSQTPYFDLLDEITRITKERIDAESNIASIAENRDTPFGPSGKATNAANDNAAVVGAIGETNDILRNIGRMLATGTGGQGGRLFATEPFL